jgi:hypothetical protein
MSPLVGYKGWPCLCWTLLKIVVVRLADYWDEGHASEASNEPDTPGSATVRDDAWQLPSKAFRLPLLEAMYELGGRATSKQATDLVGKKIWSLLGPGDHKVRSDGKERWQNSVHWNRLQLKLDGLFKRDSDHDVWELTAQGFECAKKQVAGRKEDRNSLPGDQVGTFNAMSVPSLRHTKLLSAKVGDELIRPTWNGLLFHLVLT